MNVDKEPDPGLNATPAPSKGLPQGYRQGVVAAIAVMLGFSLYFLRFWNFELPGAWTPQSVVAATLTVISVILQVIALWRSLQLEDDSPPVYQATLRWFLAGIVFVGLGVLVASFAV
jgi:hypothetical protein